MYIIPNQEKISADVQVMWAKGDSFITAEVSRWVDLCLTGSMMEKWSLGMEAGVTPWRGGKATWQGGGLMEPSWEEGRQYGGNKVVVKLSAVIIAN